MDVYVIYMYQVHIPGLTVLEVKSEQEVRTLMENRAKVNRSVGGTSMNAHSSRSHCLVMIEVKGTDPKTDVVTRGRLVLIDLAGSERVKKSEVAGLRMKEAQHINKSLAAVGDVMNALQTNRKHIP